MKYRRPGPPPDAAIKYLRDKGFATSFDYREVWKEEHARAFTVAKALDGDLLVDIRRAIDQALADGLPLAEFKKRLEPILERKGWKGYGTLLGEDGKPIIGPEGLPQDFELGTPRRLKTIYDTNLRQARGAGQYEKSQRTKKVLPYFRYTLGPSREHRTEHAAWRDLVLPVDDPFWDTHYPINGWGCKCRLIQITRREAERRGGPHQAPAIERREWVNRVTGKTELVPIGIDPGFDYHPGKARQAGLLRSVNQKLNSAPLDIAQPFARSLVESVAFAHWYSKPEGNFPVAALDDEQVAALGASERTVLLSPATLEKQAKNHPELTIEDYFGLSDLSNAETIIQSGDNKLLFFYVSGKLYKAVVKTTKGKGENYLVSLHATDLAGIEREAKKGKALLDRIER